MTGASWFVSTSAMEQFELSRFQTTGILGAGADYEVRGAVDQETGEMVVLKRPVPQMISRGLHGSTEARTDRTLEVLQQMEQPIPNVVRVLGYTERTIHDDFYGDSMGQEYRVVVEERAKGIPLMVGDMRARIRGVPTGVGQNLFALFPLLQSVRQAPFPIHHQLLDLEEVFHAQGYVLLDLRPQNIFYQPASGQVTIVDCGDLAVIGGEPDRRTRVQRNIHDAFLEIMKFYVTPDMPPTVADGYREPYGQRPVVNFEQELGELAQGYENTDDDVRAAALNVIAKTRDRSYQDIAGFRADLDSCLQAASVRNQQMAEAGQARQVWLEAMEWLREEYWTRYLFDADAELGSFGV